MCTYNTPRARQRLNHHHIERKICAPTQYFQHAGYNNLCLYIDDIPGKYITAWFFELTIVFMAIYVFLVHVSVRLAYVNGVYSKRQFSIMRVMAILDMALITYSIEVFAVHPKEDFLMHTVPFR